MDAKAVGEAVQAAAGGDAAAWEALVERFGGLVWSVARGSGLGRADAGDVCQTTWLRLTEHLHRLDKPEQVGAWLATTARREALSVLRNGGRVVPTDDQAVFERDDRGTLSPESAVLEGERARLAADRGALLWRAFGELSQRCQELLRILLADPPPRYAEVSAALGLPIGSIGPTRARCLRSLRAKLKDHDIGEPPASSC